jgi:hypothetical protein
MLETRQANEPVYYVADQLQDVEQRQNELKSLEVSLFLLKTLKILLFFLRIISVICMRFMFNSVNLLILMIKWLVNIKKLKYFSNF